jgi:hypothetical protein
MARFGNITGRGVRFRDRDLGYAELRKLFKTPNHNVVVGIVGEKAEQKHPKADATIAELAMWHEFGRGVPQRPFVRLAIDKGSRRYRREIDTIFRQAKNRGQLGPKLVKFGKGVAKDMRSALRQDDLGLARLAQSTIDEKGHDIPLLDTGVLSDAIDARVERR